MTRLILAALLWGAAQDAPPPLSADEQALLNEQIDLLAAGTAEQKVVAGIVDRFGARAVPRLVEAMRGNRALRSPCAQALSAVAGKTGLLPQESERELITVLKEGPASASGHAAWALGSIGSSAALTELLAAADHPEPWVAKAACMALGLLGGEKAREKLQLVAGNPQGRDPEVLYAAGAALDLIRRFGEPDLTGALLVLIKGTDGYRYAFHGWLQSPGRAALRKAVEKQVKDLIPHLRPMATEIADGAKVALKDHPDAARLLYVIHRLGAQLTAQEREAVVNQKFLDP